MKLARGMFALTLASGLAGLAGCPPLPPAKSAATVKGDDLPKDVAGLNQYADDQLKKQTTASVENSLVAMDKALALDKGYESLWRAARACAWLVEDVDDFARKEPLAVRGMKYAQDAVALDAAKVEGQYYLSTTTGQLAYIKKLKAKELVPVALEQAKAAVKLDEKYDHAGPLRMLGAIYTQAPEPPTSVGDHEQAEATLSKAVQIDPTYPQNHLMLGDAHRVSDHFDQAETEYNKVLAAASAPAWSHFLPRWQKLAKEGLTRVANKRRARNSSNPGGF